MFKKKRKDIPELPKKTKEANTSTPKPPSKFTELMKQPTFYAKQATKAFIIILLAYLPLDIVNGYIDNLALNMSKANNVEYFGDSARLNYASMIASGVMLMGIYTVFFKLNWSYKIHRAKLRTKKDEA